MSASDAGWYIGCSLDETLGEEVCGVLRAVSWQVRHCVLHHNLEHGRRRLKLIPGRMGHQHLHHCRTNTPAECGELHTHTEREREREKEKMIRG